MSGVEVFGRLPDGREVGRFTLSGGGITASIMPYGAAVQDLRIAGHAPPLVLGFDTFEPYLTHSAYFGAIVGRYANRIAGGRFSLHGRPSQVAQNFLGRHLLHGGEDGFFARLWDVALHGTDFVTFKLHDPAGAMGFPGALDVTCTYRLKIPGTLSIELTATADQPTLCNLAHHSWFNLEDGGTGDVLGHRMTIDAEAYLPVDPDLIPTGVVQPVGGTPFDFRRARPVGGEPFVSYDHNFCLAAARGQVRRAARVEAPGSGVAMEVWSTEPGLQFYAGENATRSVPGLDGRSYGAFAGMCLEPQIWPDSPNRPYFPQAVLEPGDIYRQVTEYRFSLA